MHFNKLDAIRGFAAFYVILYHICQHFKQIPFYLRSVFFAYGQEAVMLFFLLSGFVIYLSYARKQVEFKDYFIKRFRRIYFPFFISLLLSLLIVTVDKIQIKMDFFTSLLGNVLMLQDIKELKPGVWFDPFLGNLPLWSLAYEWWFYMLFFPLYHLIFNLSYRIYLVLGISFTAYSVYIWHPNQPCLYLSYLIIWWSGVEAADILKPLKTGRFAIGRLKPIFICLFIMLLLTTVPIRSTIHFGYYPFLIFRHFLSVIVALSLGYFWYQKKLIFFNKTIGLFKVIAPISYGLYIFHYPILFRWNISIGWLELPSKLIIIFVLAYVVEIKLQPIVNRYLR